MNNVCKSVQKTLSEVGKTIISEDKTSISMSTYPFYYKWFKSSGTIIQFYIELELYGSITIKYYFTNESIYVIIYEYPYRNNSSTFKETLYTINSEMDYKNLIPNDIGLMNFILELNNKNLHPQLFSTGLLELVVNYIIEDNIFSGFSYTNYDKSVEALFEYIRIILENVIEDIKISGD